VDAFKFASSRGRATTFSGSRFFPSGGASALIRRACCTLIRPVRWVAGGAALVSEAPPLVDRAVGRKPSWGERREAAGWPTEKQVHSGSRNAPSKRRSADFILFNGFRQSRPLFSFLQTGKTRRDSFPPKGPKKGPKGPLEDYPLAGFYCDPLYSYWGAVV